MGVSSTSFDSTSIAFRAYADDIFANDARRDPMYGIFTALGEASNLLITEHDILEAMPVIREWLGERQEPDVVFATVRGFVRTWEKTFSEDRKRALSAAANGQLLKRLVAWLGAPDADLDKICTDYLLTNPTGYDSVSLFSASHPRGAAGATQSNTSSTAFSGTQHRAVMAAGSNLTDSYGEPLGIQYDLLMVGPTLAHLAREVTGSQRYAAVNNLGAEATSGVVAASEVPSANPLKIFDGGEIRVMVNPRLSGSYANKYLYLDTTKQARPLVFYPFENGRRVVERTADSDDSRWKRDRYEWAAEIDGTLVPGAWQVAYYGGT